MLYSFPLKLGADRICYTAWQQVNGLAAAGVDLLVMPAALHRPVPVGVTVCPTLSCGRLRLPNRIVRGPRYGALHDWIVARRLERLLGRIDIVHTWPSGALRTLRAAARLGIPTVLERPNAHTRFALEVVQNECLRLGVTMPPGHEHGDNPAKIQLEEEEFRLADGLLCPSDFVVHTFLDRGFPREKLIRHQYGFDEKVFFPPVNARDQEGLTALFVGACAPRKGLHYALEAWLRSPACKEGQFIIAGDFIPGYAERLAPMLSHSSVKTLGHRRDVSELMRTSDILVLPSLEEGSALVTSEARGSGCVLLVSEAAGAMCKHMETGLIHPVGDILTLTQHITLLHENRSLLRQLRATSLDTVTELTWSSAGKRLLEAYREVTSRYARISVGEPAPVN